MITEKKTRIYLLTTFAAVGFFAGCGGMQPPV